MDNNLYRSTYYIDKSSNTFADNLAAFGLAYVLYQVVKGRAEVRMEDQGAVFAIVCEPSIQPDWVEQTDFFAGAPFLVTLDRKSGQKAIKGTSLAVAELPEQGGELVVDYEVEKTKNAAFFEWLKGLTPENRRKAVQGELEGPAKPHPDWDIFRAVNPAALQGYNSLMAEWWQAREAFPQALQVLLQYTSQTPNDVEGGRAAWGRLSKANGWVSKDATAIQLLNPSQGKGTNSSKAVWSNPSNLKEFWLLEWLKIVGLFRGGFTRVVANPKDPRNAKDRKTYVLSPVCLGWNMHQAVMMDFRRAMAGSATAVKLDILAALRYMMVFLKHYEGARVEDLGAEVFGEPPADLVSGMQMAFYKNLGSAVATMNIASINLPRWVRPHGPQDLALFQAALDEHMAIVSSLDETRGEGFELLSRYRDFLSGTDLTPFFLFTSAYSGFIISQRERKKYARQFTTTTLEVLFMNSDDQRKTFSQIAQNEGFRNIAYAIRHSTVVPQSRKGHGERPVVDIRYGLGQQLTRKAEYPAEFLAELAGFAHLYNAENAQLREKKRNPRRKNLTTQDLDMVTALMDQFGSKVVCYMLVAYGYAREPYEPSSDSEQPESEISVEFTDEPGEVDEGLEEL